MDDPNYELWIRLPNGSDPNQQLLADDEVGRYVIDAGIKFIITGRVKPRAGWLAYQFFEIVLPNLHPDHVIWFKMKSAHLCRVGEEIDLPQPKIRFLPPPGGNFTIKIPTILQLSKKGRK